MSAQLIAEGRPRFGHFADALAVDPALYQHRGVTGGRAGPIAQKLGFKQFQYFGLLGPDLLAGCAIAHLRHVAVAFVYVYQPSRGMLFEKTYRAPFGWGCTLSDSPLSGQSHFRAGKTRIQLGYQDQPRVKTLSVEVPGQLRINATMDETAADFEPMSLCTRIGRNGWVYAHKVAGVATSGELECGGQRFSLDDGASYGHHDFSAGYMRRETFWNWACFSGRIDSGQAIGLNVSCGVNETSFSENCYWLDGQLHRLGLCQFDYDWDQPAGRPWTINSGDGRLHLAFQPAGQHQERLNLGWVASDFKQIFGLFEGEIRHADGRRLQIKGLPGFVEDQYAKW